MSKKPFGATWSWASSIHCTGHDVSVKPWISRNKGAWQPSRSLRFPRSSSTTKTSPMSNGVNLLQWAARFSRPRISISLRHGLLWSRAGAEQTRFNKHRQGLLRGEVFNHRPFHCQASKTGNLRRHLVGRPVHSRLTAAGRRIIAAVQIAQLVRQMFWKCSTTLHGESR